MPSAQKPVRRPAPRQKTDSDCRLPFICREQPASADACFADCEEHSAPTLVWVDDYEPGLAVYKMVYEELGYQVHTATNGYAGLEILAALDADAVILDYEMPNMNGGLLARVIKKRWPSLPVIMFSACTTIPTHMNRVLDGFCDKAEGREHLHHTIKTVLEKRHSSLTTSSTGTQPGRLHAIASHAGAEN